MADRSYDPYAESHVVNRRMPESGRGRDEILAELRAIATDEEGWR